MYSYTNSERECLWCEQPIQGRADKQFCSSSCKARYNRENTRLPDDEPEMTIAPVRLALPTAPPSTRRVLEDEDTDEEEKWQAEVDKAEHERQFKEQAQKLHLTYVKQADNFLQSEGNNFFLEEVEEFLDELDAAAADYREHPGLARANHPAHNRLADLYLMRDYVRKMRDELLDADEESGFFNNAEPPQSCLELSKKHRKRFRLNLIGEK